VDCWFVFVVILNINGRTRYNAMSRINTMKANKSKPNEIYFRPPDTGVPLISLVDSKGGPEDESEG